MPAPNSINQNPNWWLISNNTKNDNLYGSASSVWNTCKRKDSDRRKMLKCPNDGRDSFVICLATDSYQFNWFVSMVFSIQSKIRFKVSTVEAHGITHKTNYIRKSMKCPLNYSDRLIQMQTRFPPHPNWIRSCIFNAKFFFCRALYPSFHTSLSPSRGAYTHMDTKGNQIKMNE